MSLLKNLSIDLTKSRPAAMRRYIEILTDDVDDAGQMEELKTLMAQLGKRIEDCQDDREILMRVRTLQGTIRNGRDLREAIAAAERELSDYSRQATEQIRAIEARRTELALIVGDASDRHQAALTAADALAKFKVEQPVLLAEITPPKLSEV